ncbi:protein STRICTOSIDINE SYNTHASE-LIKE 4-like [Coffea eugenioides]|uniref:protein STRICTOSIDINE SYNTHASE-LIKE 4-like n=1 Tax=Coffea eugenioides TaxID=49369 RepID=UPI000F615045|nr:protein STRICTOSIDINE SYNTHASE-LIKE 4-like [Coffea eugenioides]
MSESAVSSSTETSIDTTTRRKSLCSFANLLVISLVLPVVLAVVVYQVDPFNPAPYPAHELTQKKPLAVPKRNAQVLKGAEKIGVGELLGPEDIAYDPKSGKLYTGCADGWIKRVTVSESAADSVVENWLNTGGRPLGLVLGLHGELIIADADKGLLNATENGEIQLLTDEADGTKFKLTDGVDISEDGTIYFTDASSKYSISEVARDSLEGRPYGRFLSYNPSTKVTQVLVRDLYFANGVAVSPDQDFVIFCETRMRRCKRYYLKGERKGSVDTFVDNLPGRPDNIRYDGEGQYWIALTMEATYALELVQRHAFIRKIMAIAGKYLDRPPRLLQKNGGAFAVDLEGKPTARYYDHDLALVTGVVKIENYIYFGFIIKPYLIRLNMEQNPAVIP